EAARDSADKSQPARACRALLRARWEGKAVEVPSSFPRPPSSHTDWIAFDEHAPPTAVARLRERCDARVGSLAKFPASLGALAKIGAAIGDQPGADPWRVE